jgi:hypothetical protein
MTNPTAQEVYDFIMNHINSTGISYNRWYVGIATSPRTRLFTDHNVSEQNDKWVYKDAGTDTVARQVEEYIINTHKTQGDTGGGDKSTTFVYAYVITNTTRE